MALTGDLETLDFADLFQNLEQHQRSGTLTLRDGRHETQFYFEGGQLSMLARAGRRPLVEVLVDSGQVSERSLEAARSKRRGSGRSLGEFLVQARNLKAEELHAFGLARLFDDACELVTETRGEFEFVEGPVPRGIFDPEERRLSLAIPARQLLLEAARRADQFGALKTSLGPESSFYIGHRDTPLESLVDDVDLAAGLLQRLDGTRRLGEVLEAYPARRFEAMSMLAFLAERQVVRRAGPDDLAVLAAGLPAREAERARHLVDAALELYPRHAGLLEQGAENAERAGTTSLAVERWKELAHLRREHGDDEGWRAARHALERARELAPGDATLLEGLIELARREGESGLILRDGMSLAELYREQGLSKKVVHLLEDLARLDPESFEIERRLAHARASAGDRRGAVAGLLRRGREAVGKERYPTARQAFAEVLELDPELAEAREAVEAIDQDLYARRRQERRRLALRLAVASALALLGTLLLRESRARADYSRALSAIATEQLIERREYGEVRQRLEQVAQRHPWTTTSSFDLPRRLRDLERSEDRVGTGIGLQGPDRIDSGEPTPGTGDLAGQPGHHGGRSAE